MTRSSKKCISLLAFESCGGDNGVSIGDGDGCGNEGSGGRMGENDSVLSIRASSSIFVLRASSFALNRSKMILGLRNTASLPSFVNCKTHFRKNTFLVYSKFLNMK